MLKDEIKGLVKDDTTIIEFPPLESNVIYFLVNDDVVVYIGQSTNYIERIYSHKTSGKAFCHFYVLEVEEDDLNNTEAKFIAKYEPIYNKEMPPNSIYLSIRQLSAKHNLDVKIVERIVSKCDLKTYLKRYYNAHQFTETLDLLARGEF